MPRIDRILAVADREMVTTPALRRAAELARARGAALQLCVLVCDPLIEAGARVLAACGDRDAPQLLAQAKDCFMQEWREWAAARVDAWHRQGITAEYEVIWAPAPAETLVAKAVESGAELVVKDAPHASGMLHRLHTPDDWKMIRICPVPLMLVGRRSAPRIKRITAAVDAFQEQQPVAAELNEAVLRTARQIADICHAQVELASAYPWTATVSAVATRLTRLRQQADREHCNVFSALAERLDVPENRRHRLQGLPVTALAHYVERSGTDLLVVGSAYRNGFTRFLIGSTTEELISKVSCDLLIVRPADFLLELQEHLDIRRLLRESAEDTTVLRHGRLSRPQLVPKRPSAP